MNKKNKIFALSKLKKIIINTRKNKKVGLCHGVFDLLHLGHIKHFEEAKKNCDVLIVSVTQNKFIKKGPGRPAFNEIQRMEALSSLEFIDYVTLSNQESSIDVINEIKPNIYFKGPDYKDIKLDVTKKILLENKSVLKNGGQIYITKFKKFSSSSLLNSQTSILTEEQKFISKKIKKKFNFKQIKEIIESLYNLKPLVIGELIIDKYFFCEALGKSGKEPMLVLKDKYNESYLGGAAAICRHLSEFCKNINFISAIGEKKEHLNFIKINLPKNIKYFFLKKKNSPTIVKKRFLDEITKSKLLGVYSLEDNLVNNIEEKIIIKKFNNFSKKSHLTILSDYGHGMISKNLSEIIKKKSKFIAVNVQINAANVGHHTLQNYKSVDFMIINENELRHEMRSKNEDIFVISKQLAKQFRIKYLAVTQGSKGLFLYNKNKNVFYKSPALEKNVLDKVGAGDAMLSILSICIYKKIDINLALLICSFAAAQSIRTMGNKVSTNKNTLIKEIEHFLS
jgi:rfaE bifunctional protein kinase chain/domain/rfaE bifunctional protein nucleotidyltransferase chain/domain